MLWWKLMVELHVWRAYSETEELLHYGKTKTAPFSVYSNYFNPVSHSNLLLKSMGLVSLRISLGNNNSIDMSYKISWTFLPGSWSLPLLANSLPLTASILVSCTGWVLPWKLIVVNKSGPLRKPVKLSWTVETQFFYKLANSKYSLL